MATSTKEKSSLFANLKDKLNEEPAPVIQTQVQAPKAAAKKAEQLVSFHMPAEKLTALKMKAAADNTTMKELINNALLNYYNI